MKIKCTIILILFLSFNGRLISQVNSFKYFGQYYTYGKNDMKGIRQTLAYSYPLGKNISIEGQIFTGSGRGRDISNNFRNDFAMISKNNESNVPPFFRDNLIIYEGIHSYSRISEGLKQDNGWGLSINFVIINQSKLNLDVSLGYLAYETKAIIRDNLIELKVTSNQNSNITDYSIIYPAGLHLKYRDGAGFARLNTTYMLAERITLGLNCNINYSFWGTGIDYGFGFGFNYNLNTIERE